MLVDFFAGNIPQLKLPRWMLPIIVSTLTVELGWSRFAPAWERSAVCLGRPWWQFLHAEVDRGDAIRDLFVLTSRSRASSAWPLGEERGVAAGQTGEIARSVPALTYMTTARNHPKTMQIRRLT